MFERRKLERISLETLESARLAATPPKEERALSPAPLVLPIDRLGMGKWRISGISEEDVLKAGLVRLDSAWGVAELQQLLVFPRRKDGCPQLLREKLIADLLIGTHDLKSVAPGDVSCMQGDVIYLSLRQLLRLRVQTLSFAARGDAFETHASLLMKLDGLLFERFGQLAVGADSPLLPDTATARSLGIKLVRIMAVAQAVPKPQWWVCWIGEQRAFFDAESFACTAAFPSDLVLGVAEVEDTSRLDRALSLTARRFDWKVTLVWSEEGLRAQGSPRPCSSAAAEAAASFGANPGAVEVTADVLLASRRRLKPTVSTEGLP